MTAFESRVRFILADPSIPANIGSAARAIKTMGFRSLWVSNPRVRDYKADPEAIRLATQADDVLAESHRTDTLLEALEGVRFAWALSGYDREYGPPICELEQAAAASASILAASDGAAGESGDIAFVFGTERDGLANSEVLLCQGIAAIPASSEMTSLNLAQAVQVCAYEMRRALRSARGEAGQLLPWETRFRKDPPAGARAIEGLMGHLEQALAAVGMAAPGDHRKMMERLRTIFDRAAPSDEEVVLLRAICAAVVKPRTKRIASAPQELDAAPASGEDSWKAGRAK